MRAIEIHKHFYLGSFLVGGFHFDYKPGFKFSIGKGRIKPSFVIKIQWRKGAGYIGGMTWFFGFNTGSAQWYGKYRDRYYNRVFLGIETGFTRNGNHTPYVSH